LKGGDSFSVTCSPSGNVQGPNGGFGLSVDYSVSISPVTINVPNALLGSVLVGQQIAPQLQGTVGTVSGYGWTVPSDPKTFKSYAINNSTGTVTNLGAGDLTVASPVWYYWTAGTSTITCSATCQTPGGNLNVTAQKQLTVQVPVSTFTAVQGTTVLNGGTISLMNAPLNGETWTAAVQIPSAFSSEGAGSYFIGQLVTPNRSKDDQAVRVSNFTLNGVYVLDTMIPVYNLQWTTGTSANSTGDTPSQGVASPFTHAHVADQFTSYLFFIPPLANSYAVPVKYLNWSWGGDLYLSPTTGVYSIANPAQNSDGSGGNVTALPQWTQNVTSGTFP